MVGAIPTMEPYHLLTYKPTTMKNQSFPIEPDAILVNNQVFKSWDLVQQYLDEMNFRINKSALYQISQNRWIRKIEVVKKYSHQ